jgi:hypothetical protein
MTLSMQRSDHSGLTPQEIGDRLAIRELVDAYAHCADRRDVEGQMSLFTADTEFLVYMDSRNAVPTQEIRGRDGLRPVFRESEHVRGDNALQRSEHRDVGTGLRNGGLLLPCAPRKGCWPQSESDDRFNPVPGSFREDGRPLVLPATKVDGRLDRQPPTRRRLTRLARLRLACCFQCQWSERLSGHALAANGGLQRWVVHRPNNWASVPRSHALPASA